jgi:hypothetical protein
MIYLPKFGITNFVIPTSPLRKFELLTRPTPSRVSFNCFPHFTKYHKALASFLSEMKWVFTNFLKAHHKLARSRVTSSCLEDFTSKSNECFTSA